MGDITGPATVDGEILLIPVDEIDASERLRPIDDEWATALGQIMLRDGQLTPIEVCRLPGRKGYTLVSGGHRHAAASTFLDLSPLRAIVVSHDKAERRLREVSENLWRRGLDPFDRATFIAELVTLQKLKDGIDATKDGRAASVNVRWQKALKNEAQDTNDTMSHVYGWSDKVAEVVGVTRRTIERDLLLYRRLSPAVIESLRKRNHPALRKAADLKALAALEPSDQQYVKGLLIHASMSDPRAPYASVGEAIAAMNNKVRQPKSDEQKRLDAFVGAFSRMSVSEKKGALALLADLLPAGFVLTSSTGSTGDKA